METGPGSDTATVRREDPPLLTGNAEYTDDLARPGMTHAAVVRSPYGHARIEAIDTAPALQLDGVVAVYTAADVLASEATNTLGFPKPSFTVGMDHPLLAVNRVRYQGQPVAVVVAEGRYTARTAADLVDVRYDRLDSVVDAVEAARRDSPTIHDDASDNVAYEWDVSEGTGKYMDSPVEAKDLDSILEAADHVVDIEVVNNRVIPNAMEPRAALAEYRSATDQLTVVMTTQNPHLHQQWLGNSLNHPQHKLRVQAHDVGGGFGSKNYQYPAETLTAWCAKRLERPVKWQATRREDLASTFHGRDHYSSAEVGLDAAGRILGLRARTTANLGAFDQGAHVPVNYAQMVSGQYDIPAIDVTVTGVFTNTAPLHAYRGAGRPEATYLIERVLQACAKEVEMDPPSLRRKNFVPENAFPYTTATGLTYDSGAYEKPLDRAIELIDYEDFRERQRDARERGRLIGIGFSCYVEATAYAPGLFESGSVQFKPSGQVLVKVGTFDHGQGHHTTFAQIIAEELGVPPDDIKVIDGDTDAVQEGNGTYGSRSGSIGGSAVKISAEKIKAKARRFATYELEVAEEDLGFEGGVFFVSGAPERSLSIQTIAHSLYTDSDRPDDMEPGLEASTYFEPSNYAYPFGTHATIVEVDPETGEIDILDYVAVDDVGNQINPMIVEGQIHGGVAQGLGQALFEEAVYDRNGTLLTGSLQDYALPKAEDVPRMRVASTVTPTPLNPLGAKGAGEAGTVAAPPAVVNAVVDALEPLGIEPGDVDMPLDSESIWNTIRTSCRSATWG